MDAGREHVSGRTYLVVLSVFVVSIGAIVGFVVTAWVTRTVTVWPS